MWQEVSVSDHNFCMFFGSL